jgi:hypothetical protein
VYPSLKTAQYWNNQAKFCSVAVTKLHASRPQTDCRLPCHVAVSRQYSVASFAMLLLLSCLHSPGLCCSCCNVVRSYFRNSFINTAITVTPFVIHKYNGLSYVFQTSITCAFTWFNYHTEKAESCVLNLNKLYAMRLRHFLTLELQHFFLCHSKLLLVNNTIYMWINIPLMGSLLQVG